MKVGSDFSGVGAFDQALRRLGIEYQTIFACDMDKYARDTFVHNYGEPGYFPMNVYDREIPKESLDIYMTSPPCQSFSLAGKRLGKEDKRGILFFNSHEFIQVNKPRYFIFENVKGLLSDDNGKTFNEWVNLLGGKSVNGLPILFPYDGSLNYHLYWKVLNSKDFGVPQNRERVFLIGIRDDKDNKFQFPKAEYLSKKLKDVLEDNVQDKYFLSEKTIENLLVYNERQKENETGFSAKFRDVNKIKIMNALKVGGGGKDDLIKVKSATLKGYESATFGDSISLSHPGSQTRRGRVGNQIAQTIDSSSIQGVVQINPSKESGGKQPYQQNRIYDSNGLIPPLMSNLGVDRNHNILYNDKRLNETIQKNDLPNGQVKAIDTYNKKIQNNAPTLREPHHNTTRLWDGFKIRRLTPRECFRLMDFPDSFTWRVSDSQAYKQAGNSIVVNVLYNILKQLIK
jgi:DNA (cytosine-5)-methyltransferase 1